MRFDVVGLARPRTPRDDALRVGAKHGDSVNDGCNHVAQPQDQAWQDTLHEGGSVGTVALSRACGEVGMFGAGSAHQGGDVVGQHLGRHVDDQGLLRQPGDGFEFEALLDAFECLLDTPSLVVEVAEERGREVLGVQVGGEQAQLAVGRSLAHQAHLRGLGGASPVAHVIGAGGVERDPGIFLPRAPERLGRTPAAVV